jgi:acyl carrier protein
MDEKTEVREFVQGILRRNGDSREFSDSESLIASGRMQSVDALELMVFLEEKYRVDVAQPGFDQYGLDNIDGILALIKANDPSRIRA